MKRKYLEPRKVEYLWKISQLILLFSKMISMLYGILEVWKFGSGKFLIPDTSLVLKSSHTIGY